MPPTFVQASNQLAPGVAVKDIRTAQDHYSDRIELSITLLVNRQQFGQNALDGAMQALGLIFNQTYEKLGPQNGANTFEEANTSYNRMMHPEKLEEEREDLRKLIERRFDEVDQALRLLVDP